MTIKVAKRYAEVRKEEEAAGAGAVAYRSVVTDEEGQQWEEFTESAARIEAAKIIAREEAEEEQKKLAKLPKKERARVLEEKKEREQEEGEKIVLVDEEVELRGNVTPAERKVANATNKQKSKGTLFISLIYMPFNKPEFDDDIEMKPAKGGLAAYVPFEPPRARAIAANVSDFQKGLLTVTLIGAKSLASSDDLLASSNPYVELVLVDCDKLRCDERKWSRTMYNDKSPRWGDKFDFVMVSAGSVLNINVWDKTSPWEMVASLKLSKSRFQDKPMGRVTIPVADVVRNGHLRDTWALQDAKSGTLEMKLEWQDCFVDDYVD